MKQFDNLVILLLESISPEGPAIKWTHGDKGTKKQENCQAGTKKNKTARHRVHKLRR